MKPNFRQFILLVLWVLLWFVVFGALSILLTFVHTAPPPCHCPVGSFCDCPFGRPYVAFFVDLVRSPSGLSVVAAGLFSVILFVAYYRERVLEAGWKRMLLSFLLGLCAYSVLVRELTNEFFDDSGFWDRKVSRDPR